MKRRLAIAWAISILSAGSRYAAAEEAPPSTPASDEEPSLALTAPPPKGRGALVGVVREPDGAPAMDTYVGVVGTKIAVLTDIDGAYRLELPPGSYVLQFVAELHRPLRSEALVVTTGGLTRLDATVELEGTAEEPAVETVIKVDTQSVEGLLLERQRGAAAGDAVGRAEITKAADRNAAEAAKRVVGANLEGSRFLFVRGLGERYTNALLDGFPLPSPEPDRQAVPLDLFPAQILESLTVVKTFTPDVPADFAGGSVRIATRRIPEKLTLSGSVSVGFNTQSTFADVLGYQGGSLDFLGIDDGGRALPEDFPSSKVVRGVERPDGSLIDREAITAYGRELDTPMTARASLGAPNLSGNLVAADSWALGNWGRLGALAALVYDRRIERIAEGRLRTWGFGSGGDDELTTRNDLTLERGAEIVSWGGLGSVTLEAGEDHRISLTGLYTRSADVRASRLHGFHEERSASLTETRLSFVSRQLVFGELSGSERIAPLGGLRVDYGVGLARATRDEPDSRGTTYQYDGTLKAFAFEDDSTSGSHFFSGQGETTWAGTLDLTQPLAREKELFELKLGGAFDLRDREFLARRFRFRPDRKKGAEGFDLCPGPSFAEGCQERLFSEENIDSGALELEENTRENDGYRAGLRVVAGYLMLDARPIHTLRVTLGPRIEASKQTITPFDPVNPNLPTEERELSDVEVLPALALAYSPIERANLRLSLTRTLARPQLRELAPFSYVDYFGGREIRGNPELQNTSVVNADTRFEWFPTAREVVAVSAFYKRFVDPIEQVIQASTGSAGVVSFDNALGGDLFGVELEARKSFDMIVPELRPLTMIANVTLAHSVVELDPARAQELTSATRPLSAQAPYIVNAALDFDPTDWGFRARVQYNVVGPRLVQVGTHGIPDIYELPRHGLDVSIAQRIGPHVELRGSATNLIDGPVVKAHQLDRGEAVTEEYRLGRSFSLGVQLSN